MDCTRAKKYTPSLIVLLEVFVWLTPKIDGCYFRADADSIVPSSAVMGQNNFPAIFAREQCRSFPPTATMIALSACFHSNCFNRSSAMHTPRSRFRSSATCQSASRRPAPVGGCAVNCQHGRIGGGGGGSATFQSTLLTRM